MRPSLGILLLLPFVVLLSPLAISAEEADEITSIRIHFAGLGGSHNLTAWSDGEKAWIRESSEPSHPTRFLLPRDAMCELTMEEWNGIVGKIRKVDLLNWKPEVRKVFDAPTVTLEIKGSTPVTRKWEYIPDMPDKAGPFQQVQSHLENVASRKTRDVSTRASALKVVDLAFSGLEVGGRLALSLGMRRTAKGLEIVAKYAGEAQNSHEERAFAMTETEWNEVATILYLRDMAALKLKAVLVGPQEFDHSGTLRISDGREIEQAWKERPQDWGTITWLGERMAAIWVAAAKRAVEAETK